MSRAEQDKIFKRNAHIRQKLWGAAFTIIFAVTWLCLWMADREYAWFGLIFVPLILGGLWTVITNRNYAWELKGEREWLAMNRSRKQTMK